MVFRRPSLVALATMKHDARALEDYVQLRESLARRQRAIAGWHILFGKFESGEWAPQVEASLQERRACVGGER